MLITSFVHCSRIHIFHNSIIIPKSIEISFDCYQSIFFIWQYFSSFLFCYHLFYPFLANSTVPDDDGTLFTNLIDPSLSSSASASSSSSSASTTNQSPTINEMNTQQTQQWSVMDNNIHYQQKRPTTINGHCQTTNIDDKSPTTTATNNHHLFTSPLITSTTTTTNSTTTTTTTVNNNNNVGNKKKKTRFVFKCLLCMCGFSFAFFGCVLFLFYSQS